MAEATEPSGQASGTKERRRRSRSRANGEGSVYADKDGRFVAQIVVGWRDGKPRYKRKKVATVKAGREWLEEVKAALAEGLEPPDDRLTVGQWLEQWLPTLEGTVADSTVAEYRKRASLYITPHLSSVPVRKLTPRLVSAWLTTLRSSGLAPATCQSAYSTLRRALTVAQQEGLVPRNVAAIADGPRHDGRSARWATPEDARALLAAAKSEPLEHAPGRPLNRDRLAAAVAVLVGTGVRRGELLGLRWSDLDLDAPRPTLTVRGQIVRQAGGLIRKETKTGRSRTLPLASFVVIALKEHKARQAAQRLAAGPLWVDHGLVFTTDTGSPVDARNLAKSLERLAKAAGIDHVNPHALRHGAVSMLLAEGVPLEVASEIAGHSSIRVTKDVYGHLLTDHLGVAADAFDRALGSPVASTS